MFLGLLTRCRDEFYIKEFCDYYLSQGVDKLYVIDDDSENKSIYDNIKNDSKYDERVSIIFEKNIIKKKFAESFYKKIKEKDEFEWLIYVDVDEFISTRKNTLNTIRDELESTFKDADCVVIPWIMM